MTYLLTNRNDPPLSPVSSPTPRFKQGIDAQWRSLKAYSESLTSAQAGVGKDVHAPMAIVKLYAEFAASIYLVAADLADQQIIEVQGRLRNAVGELIDRAAKLHNGFKLQQAFTVNQWDAVAAALKEAHRTGGATGSGIGPVGLEGHRWVEDKCHTLTLQMLRTEAIDKHLASTSRFVATAEHVCREQGVAEGQVIPGAGPHELGHHLTEFTHKWTKAAEDGIREIAGVFQGTRAHEAQRTLASALTSLYTRLLALMERSGAEGKDVMRQAVGADSMEKDIKRACKVL